MQGIEWQAKEGTCEREKGEGETIYVEMYTVDKGGWAPWDFAPGLSLSPPPPLDISYFIKKLS